MKLKSVKALSAAVLAFSLVFALLLVGCGNNTENTQTPNDSAVSSEKAAPAQEKAAEPESGSESTSSADDKLISKKKAKKIALKDAGLKESQVSNLRIALQKDDGIQEYEVEFYAGDMEYDYEIHAVSGKILERDADSIYD